MVLRPGKHISHIEAMRETLSILIVRKIVLLLHLSSTAIIIASKITILRGSVGEKRSELSGYNIRLNSNIVNTEVDVAEVY